MKNSPPSAHPEINQTTTEPSPTEMRAQLEALRQHQQQLELENATLRSTSKKIESRLARYTDLYDLAPIAYFSLEHKGLIQQTNLAGANLLRTPYAQVAQKNFLDFIHPQTLPTFNTFLTNVFSGYSKDSCEIELNIPHEETGAPKCHIKITGFVDDSDQLCLLTATDITKSKLAAKALQISEERWSFALDGTGDGVWDWDILSGEVLFSKRQKEIWGGSEADIENRIEEFQKRIHPEDQPAALKTMQNALIGKTSSYVSEHRTLRQDGSWIWILARGMVVSRSSDGKPLRMVGTHTDLSNSKSLTEKMQLTARLQESHDLLAKLGEQVPGALYQFRMGADGTATFPYISSGILEMHELTPEQVMQDAALLYASVHPDDIQDLTLSLVESANSLQSWRHEFRVILPRQGLRWRLSIAQPERQPDGSIIWHGFTQGITKRKKIEQALKDSEYRWKFALEGSGDGVWDWDLQTNEVVLSKYWQENYGLLGRNSSDTREDWQGRIHPDDAAQMMADVHAYLEGKTSTYTNKHRQLNKNNEYKWILSRGIVVSRDADGHPLRMIGTHSDITTILETEQRARELLQQNRSLMGRMFNLQEMERRHISRELHDELGQWLTAIQAEAEVIRGYSGANRETKILASARTISTSAAEVHELVRRMLRRLRPSLLDALGLEDSLHEMVAQWNEHQPNTHCNLIISGPLSGFSESLNITVYRIVQEMLTNIAKHAQARQVSVELRRAMTPDANKDTSTEMLLLSVADDGKGMDPATTTPRASHGLGLLGIRERVIAAEGEYHIASKPGTGVRIDVQLPLNRPFAEDENNQEIGAYPVQPF